MSTEIELSVQEAQTMIDQIKLDPDSWKAYQKRTEAEKVALGVIVLNHILAGKSLRTIEKEIGLNRMTISRYRDKALQAIALPTVDEARKLEIERLEALIEAVWPTALTGDKDAIASYIKLSDRMGKITGTDKPLQVEQTITEVTQQEREMQILIMQAEQENEVKMGELSERGN